MRLKNFTREKLHSKPPQKRGRRGPRYSILVCRKYSVVNPPAPDRQKGVYTTAAYALLCGTLGGRFEDQSMAHSLYLTPSSGRLIKGNSVSNSGKPVNKARSQGYSG